MCAAWRVGVVVILLWPPLAAEVPARESEGPTGSAVQEPSPAAIAAWARAGAVYGGLRINGVEWVFTARAPLAPGRSRRSDSLSRRTSGSRTCPPSRCGSDCTSSAPL